MTLGGCGFSASPFMILLTDCRAVTNCAHQVWRRRPGGRLQALAAQSNYACDFSSACSPGWSTPANPAGRRIAVYCAACPVMAQTDDVTLPGPAKVQHIALVMLPVPRGVHCSAAAKRWRWCARWLSCVPAGRANLASQLTHRAALVCNCKRISHSCQRDGQGLGAARKTS